MPGSLVALVAKSDEDKYLTGNPQITFWKSSHKRHSNFALQRYQITRPTSRLMSTTVDFKIEHVGDLLRGLTLEITLPDITDISSESVSAEDIFYTDNVGCAAIDKIEFIINGQVIQTLWGDWIAGYEFLVENFGKQYALDELRGGDVVFDGTTGKEEGSGVGLVARIPLPFWFSRTSGCAVPLVGLKHTDVRVRTYLRPYDQLVYSPVDIRLPGSCSYGSVQLFADVVHLDREERSTFSSSPLEYLVETVQQNNRVLTAAKAQLAGSESVPLGTVDVPTVMETVPLQLSLPTKELVWFLQPQPKSTTYCDMSTNRWLQFPVGEHDSVGNFYADLIQDVTLRVGGQSVFETEKADWFRLEQPIRYHTNVPAQRMKGVYIHSFAIRPEEYQPSGTLNFSAVDKAELIISMSRPTQNYNLVVYAWGYNVLRVSNGLGSLAYSY
jgi:hypothetical protein